MNPVGCIFIFTGPPIGFYPGYHHILATDLFFLLNAPPLLHQLCTFWGRATCDSFCSTGIPDPWLYDAIITGARKVVGRSPGSVPRFWSLYQGTLFRSEFWNTILITFFPVISLTGWWLKWHYTLLFFSLD
jgi:hypothetical protein